MIREYDRLNRFSVKLTCTLNTRDYNDQLSRYHTQTKQLNPTSDRSIFFLITDYPQTYRWMIHWQMITKREERKTSEGYKYADRYPFICTIFRKNQSFSLALSLSDKYLHPLIFRFYALCLVRGRMTSEIVISDTLFLINVLIETIVSIRCMHYFHIDY